MVRELAGTVHWGMQGTTSRLLRLMMRWMLLLLHSRSWTTHVIRMVMVVMMAGGIHMGCGHAGLRHLTAMHVLVDVVCVGRRWLRAWRTVVEVGLVV